MLSAQEPGLHFKVHATGLGGEDSKGRGMRLKVAEMKTGDAWTMKKAERESRGETRGSLLKGSSCHCLGSLWVMRMQGQDQLLDPCPILILCSSESPEPRLPLRPCCSSVAPINLQWNQGRAGGHMETIHPKPTPYRRGDRSSEME